MTSSPRSTSFRTRMVALAAGTGMLLGSSTMLAPTAMAKPPATANGNDLQCSSPHGVHPLVNRGKQILTIDGETGPGIATGGSVITVNGYGFTDKQQDRPNFKINDHSPEDEDGEPFLPAQPKEFGTVIAPDGRSYNPDRDDLMPDSNGRFSIKFKLPEAGDNKGQIGYGLNWMRVLSANPYFSHYALFLVVPEDVAAASKNTRLEIGPLKSVDNKYQATVTGSGFTPNAKVELTYNCQALTTVTADAEGKFSQAIGLPTKVVESRVDRQIIARELGEGSKLTKAAVGYNTETKGGSDASVVVPEADKAPVANGKSLTEAEINAVIEVAKKFVPRGDKYSYNAAENRVEIYTDGNHQTRFYSLDTFANVKSNNDAPNPNPNPQPNPGGAGPSPVMVVVIALVTLLGLGGALFGVYNWARSLGLVR